MQLPAEIWQDDILSYLNTDNRAQFRGTRQSVAKKVPQTPVCTPWECVWRPTLCLEKCERFWTYLENLLEEFLWFLHKEVSTNPNLSNNKLSVGFWLMGSVTGLQFYRGPQMDRFLCVHSTQNDDFIIASSFHRTENYYRQVITNWIQNGIQNYTQQWWAKANANDPWEQQRAEWEQRGNSREDDEPFTLQLTVEGDVGDVGLGTYLHELVQHEFCGPRARGVGFGLYVYDVSTPESVSILITDYPPTKAKTSIPITDHHGFVHNPQTHKPLWKTCT